MKVSDFGERALVELARKICKRGPRVEIGIGDDAAAIDIDGRNCMVVTTDMLVHKKHFPPHTSAEQMGHKAVVANLSDLAAMGAMPFALVFSVGLPRNLDVSFVERMIRSMDVVARKYEAYVVGGDLSETDDIIIAGTAFGVAEKRRILTRAGARPGDSIAITGKLGSASAGLEILLKKLPSEGYGQLTKAQLEPIARVKEGILLSKSGRTTSAIDVTDGLAANLWQLSRESKVKLIVDRAKVPVHPLVEKFAARHGLDADDFVFFGGDDFELLFTVRAGGWKKIQLALRRVGTVATQIGHATRGRGVFIQAEGEMQALPDRGYEHFK